MADWLIAFAGRLARLDLTADWPIGSSRLEPIDCRVTRLLVGDTMNVGNGTLRRNCFS